MTKSDNKTPAPKAKKASKVSYESGDLRLHRKLKHQAYRDHIESVRMGLSKPDRIHSHIAHHSSVEWLLELIDLLIVKPLPIICGAVVGLLASGISVYYSKHLGYSYNYLLFFEFFAAGYVIEYAIELIVRAVKKSIKS
jgi:hypothetical protein